MSIATSLPPVAISPELKQSLKALNVRETEYQQIVQLLGREPNFTELSMFSALWSEHCCYKHTRHLLKTLPTKGERVLQGPGENAGVVDCGDGLHVAFKIESHNHPTAVEPFQGAGTGVGGILRDIISMNARPVALLNALRFGPIDPTDKDPVAVRNRYRFAEAVGGIGNYGNCIGVPTVAGDVYFDETYNDNPLVNAMAIGIIQPGGIMMAGAQGIGNPVLYVGSPTGRDGLGGAAFASRALDADSESADRPAVQVGDPFMGKLLLEACLEAYTTGCVVAAQDMGAAGLCCAAVEMSAKGGVGMRMDLDKVPTREPGMQAFEYLMSESQERFVFILEKGKEQPVFDVLKKWDLPHAIIGEIIEGDMVEIWHQGKLAAHVKATDLTDDCPSYDPGIVPTEPTELKARREADITQKFADVSWQAVPKTLEALLSRNNIAQPNRVFRRYDRHVRNATLETSENNCAGLFRLKTPDNKPTGKAMATSVDGNPRYVSLDPYQGTLSIMAMSARNLIAVGAEPIGITDNLNFGDPEEPDVYYQLYQSIQAMREACTAFKTPVTGGNVSLYNHTSEGNAILPSPVVGIVGLLQDETKAMSPHWKQAGHQIALIGRFQPSLGGTEYVALQGEPLLGAPPQCDTVIEAQLMDFVRKQLIENRLVSSVEDISLGGLLTALCECSFATPSNQAMSGFSVDLDPVKLSSARLDHLLFGETNGTYLISYAPEQAAAIQSQFQAVFASRPEVQFVSLGTVTTGAEAELRYQGQTHKLDLKALQTTWQQALQC